MLVWLFRTFLRRLGSSPRCLRSKIALHGGVVTGEGADAYMTASATGKAALESSSTGTKSSMS